MRLTLGIDSSTQGVKAVAWDVASQSVAFSASVNYGRDLPQFGSPDGFLPNDDVLVRHADPRMWVAGLELGLGFVLGMSKLTLNALCPNVDGYALVQDFYFSGLLLATSVLVVVVASLTAPAPDPARIESLTFATLGEDFKRENRESWTWVDVVASALVVGVVVACYAYFWNWLG